MTVKINKYISNNVFYAEINSSLNPDEISLIKKYGEPDINLGGTLTETINVPSQFKKIYSDSPLQFNSIDESIVNTWIIVIIERLRIAMETLKGNSDSFTDEIKIQI